MGSSNIENDDQEITGINITPFVDVMLVLLVIFMMTTTYMTQNNIWVNLPKASSGEKRIEKEEPLLFVLDQDSNILVEDKKINHEEIKSILETNKNKNKNFNSVAIAADEKTPYQSVISLMDEIRKNGISDFSLKVQK